MCQCWWGRNGCVNPFPFREGLPAKRPIRPAAFSTRYTVEGLAATMSRSSIMNVIRRYPSSGYSR